MARDVTAETHVETVYRLWLRCREEWGNDPLGDQAVEAVYAALRAGAADAERLREATALLIQAKDALLYVAAEPATKSVKFKKNAETKFFAAHQAIRAWLSPETTREEG